MQLTVTLRTISRSGQASAGVLARLLYAAHSHHCLHLKLTVVLAVRIIISIGPSCVPLWRVIPWALGLPFPKLLPLHVGQGGLPLQSADVNELALPA